ncbi:unnamed protein product [Leptosia nina]|uniref:Uncharacterized protein n=1 Tax=Leptosia nina TaxID=320188 RepID=A0AAV1J1T8_9NEOP
MRNRTSPACDLIGSVNVIYHKTHAALPVSLNHPETKMIEDLLRRRYCTVQNVATLRQSPISYGATSICDALRIYKTLRPSTVLRF